MRVVIDPDRCEGHGKCVKEAPEVFELGDDDLSTVKLADIPASLKAKVDQAIRLCPRQAIDWAK